MVYNERRMRTREGKDACGQESDVNNRIFSFEVDV